MKLNFVIIFASILCVFSCSSKEENNASLETVLSVQDTTDIVHYNIIIAPDWSNRLSDKLYPKPVGDEEIVEKVLDNIYPNILKNRRSENQKDKFSISFINQGLINLYDVKTKDLTIDFSSFEKQLDRINYIKDRSEKKFSQNKESFLKEYQRILKRSTKETYGADLWTYFNNGLNNLVVKEDGNVFEYNKKYYRNKIRNILILLTDGYLESGLYKKEGCINGNMCYYLSGNRIKEFRRAFKNSGQGNMQSFFKNNGYSIAPVDNPNLTNLEVLVMEMYDRSLSPSGGATVQPTDGKIMNLFWEDWLQKSGVKNFELRPTVPSPEEAEKVIMNFIGIE